MWHLPTMPDPPTGNEFITMAANEFGMAPRCRVLSRTMLQSGLVVQPPGRGADQTTPAGGHAAMGIILYRKQNVVGSSKQHA